MEQCSTAHVSALERGGGVAAKWELWAYGWCRGLPCAHRSCRRASAGKERYALIQPRAAVPTQPSRLPSGDAAPLALPNAFTLSPKSHPPTLCLLLLRAPPLTPGTILDEWLRGPRLLFHMLTAH